MVRLVRLLRAGLYFGCATVALVAVSLITPLSFAEETITKLDTPSGSLVAREALGNDCGPQATFAESCTALYLGEKVLMAESNLKIASVFPSKSDPQLVDVEAWTGGNACCWYSYIIDLTRNPPLLLKDHGFGANISRTSSGVVFQQEAGVDSLGDRLIGTYSYRLGSGHIIKLSTTPQYKTVSLTDKSIYPEDVLADPVLREPILKIIGSEYFPKFRQALGMQFPVKVVDNNFIVGSGCVPHSGCDSGGIFIIDVTNKLGWAIEGNNDQYGGEKPHAQVWGTLTPKDAVPLREIRGWLKERKIPEGMVTFVPLSHDVAKMYTTSRQSAPVTEPVTKPPASPPPPALLPADENSDRTIVEMVADGGVLKVPATINGVLTLQFIVDSGAADVAIPADVVLTLLRTGTIANTDFLGQQTYELADGSKLPSQQFVIHSLKVGGKVLEGVTGSIAPVQGGLLLGQSFLSRFKSWSIDNQKRALILIQNSDVH